MTRPWLPPFAPTLARGLAAEAAALTQGGGASVAKAAAQRVLASVARGITPIDQVMASPPTVVNGTTSNSFTNNYSAWGGQARPTSPQHPANVGSGIGAVWEGGGANPLYYGNTRAAGTANPNNRRPGPSGYRFRTSGAVFEFCSDNSYKYAIYITDPVTGVRQRISTNDLAGPTNTGTYGAWPRITFPSAADRIWELYGSSGGTPEGQLQIRGLDASAPILTVEPDPDELRIAIVGDSHVDHVGSGATNLVAMAFPNRLGEKLGTANIWHLSAGGRGFLNPGSYATYRNSLVLAGDATEARIGQQDVLFLAASTNDGVALNAAYTDAAIQEEVRLTALRAMADQPKALIVIYGPFNRTIQVANQTPVGQVIPQSRYNAIKAGVEAAADGDKRVIFLDNSPDTGTQLITSGEAATFIGPDGTHLTNTGMASIATRIANQFVEACQALAA